MNALLRAIAFVRSRRLAVLMLAALVLVPVFFAPKMELPGGTYAWLFVIDATESEEAVAARIWQAVKTRLLDEAA